MVPRKIPVAGSSQPGTSQGARAPPDAHLEGPLDDLTELSPEAPHRHSTGDPHERCRQVRAVALPNLVREEAHARRRPLLGVADRRVLAGAQERGVERHRPQAGRRARGAGPSARRRDVPEDDALAVADLGQGREAEGRCEGTHHPGQVEVGGEPNLAARRLAGVLVARGAVQADANRRPRHRARGHADRAAAGSEASAPPSG